MRSIIFLLLLSCSSLCLEQIDSMFLEKMDGTNRGYPISLIIQISFSGIPMSVKDQEFIQNVFSSFAHYQNYPNLFNPTTTIQYSVPNAGDVEERIFDIRGRLVRLFLKSYRQTGTHSVVWDSRGNSGSVVASGTYFCQVLINGSALIKKFVLIK